MSDFERPASEEAVEPPTDDGGSDEGAGGGVAPVGSTPVEPSKRRGKGSGSFLRELPVLLLIAFVLAFLLRTFVVQVFYIPSSSMEDTLQINDRMVVEKITTRFREPRRGEIWVFEGDELGTVPADQNGAQRAIRVVGQFIGIVPASARDFVKRVVGLPGDEILIDEGQVYVNGEPIDEPYVVHDDESDFGPVTVPEERLFFLGDNRPNSSDSRRSLGFVPTDHLVGRAVVIIWPVDHGGLLTGTVHDVPDRGPAQDGSEEDRDADEPESDEAALDRMRDADAPPLGPVLQPVG
jgi:signal peptidase I